MTKESERAAFEAWAETTWRREAWRHTSSTSGEWDAWQASAARAQPVGEPVAWISPFFVGKPHGFVVSPIQLTSEQVPLYAAPVAPSVLLTDEQIEAAWRAWPKTSITSTANAIKFVRSVGIKGDAT